MRHGPTATEFHAEFKQEADDWCRRSGKSECQVARELGIPQPTFNRWMLQVATAPLGTKSFLATEELKVLRREVEQLRMERDILKNAVVGSTDQCNTLWGMVAVEGDRDGTYGASGLVCGPESGPVAAMETGAVVERDRSGTRQACRIDSWRGVIERGVIPPVRTRSRWALTLADREEISRGIASDGFFNPTDRRHARASAVDRQPRNPPPWWGPHVPRR